MMPLYTKLVWRDARSHKVRTAVAILLFALPVIFVNVLAYIAVSSDGGLWRDSQPSTVYATVITSECKPGDDPTWCASAADIARTDVDRLRDSLGGEERYFTPVWHASAVVSADSDASIVAPVTTAEPESGVIGVPESGQIALSADSLKILGKNLAIRFRLLFVVRHMTQFGSLSRMSLLTQDLWFEVMRWRG